MNQTGTDLLLSPYPVTTIRSYQPNPPNNVVVDVWGTDQPSYSDTNGSQAGEGEEEEAEFSSAGENMPEGDFRDYGESIGDIELEPSTFFCGNPSKSNWTIKPQVYSDCTL